MKTESTYTHFPSGSLKSSSFLSSTLEGISDASMAYIPVFSETYITKYITKYILFIQLSPINSAWIYIYIFLNEVTYKGENNTMKFEWAF